jgi:hypothetical protein
MSWYISTLLILINLPLLPATAYWNMAMRFHLANFYMMFFYRTIWKFTELDSNQIVCIILVI